MGYVFAARYMVPSDVFSTMVVIGAICGLLDLAATDMSQGRELKPTRLKD